MITDYTITDHYNDYCYDNYYRKSRNWDEYYDSIEEEEEDEDIPDLEKDLELADRIYQDNLDRKWGIA